VTPLGADDLEPTTIDPDGDARFRRRKLAAAAGGEALGCSLYELPPGAAAWPYHHHTANEEAAFVLSGRGVLRTPAGEHDVAGGDYAAFPAAERGAHRFRVPEAATEPLRYLVVSTMVEPDVTVYPEEERIGVFAGAPPGGEGERSVHGYYRIDDDVGYWD